MGGPNLKLDELQALTQRILVAHNTSEGNAEQVATALVLAEADGQQGHGASRIPSYAAQARSGKVDGHATPVSEQVAKSALRIDARSGRLSGAQPRARRSRGPRTADRYRRRGHRKFTSSGVAEHQVEALARKGLVALSFGNGPVAIAPWGRNQVSSEPIHWLSQHPQRWRSTGDRYEPVESGPRQGQCRCPSR